MTPVNRVGPSRAAARLSLHGVSADRLYLAQWDPAFAHGKSSKRQFFGVFAAIQSLAEAPRFGIRAQQIGDSSTSALNTELAARDWATELSCLNYGLRSGNYDTN